MTLPFDFGKVPLLELDLQRTKCPLNFVQTCLALEKMSEGDVLAVVLHKEGPSAMNIPNSLAKEGHRIIHTEAMGDTSLRLWVECGKKPPSN